MESIPDDLPGQMRLIFSELADLRRRLSNKKRDGKIVELDLAKGLAKVKLSEGHKGKPFLTDWIPWTEISAGAIKTSFSPSVGEQVSVSSESGDLTDAVIDFSSPSNENVRPHSGVEAVMTCNGSRFELGATISFEAAADATTTASKIMLIGDVEITGTIKCNGVNIGDDHKHKDVTAGSAESGEPVG